MKPLRIHVFQHVLFEGPGCLTNWFEQNNCTVAYTRFYEPEFEIPALDSFDRLVVMGGPMSVNDDEQYPWLNAEKATINEAVERGKSVVGICLGSQLIASALGQRIYPNTFAEIGWFPIVKTAGAKDEQLLRDFQHETIVFHWHGDTFDIPPQASHLFYSEACPNQSFVIGNKVLALQFHLEVTEESLEGMLEHVGGELKDDRFVQDKTIIRANYPRMGANNQLLFRLMDLLD
ncbi:type 1 glutamine amidotransferase [Mangrovibacterium lignilyticum]|uniref:type 1 glutamine amidotransferase n=1 Tax=Mangrovibacterium lignilyticum TaxID=2668052 RepID=UPI0013D6C2A2|nr:amidotransferase [Mangrovibacterium lignilyticum]